MISTKLFIGCHISPDLRIKLNQSLAWKQSRLDAPSGLEPIELRHDNKDYLGFFISDNSTDLNALRHSGDQIRSAITRYCDGYPTDKINLFLFPQVFVS